MQSSILTALAAAICRPTRREEAPLSICRFPHPILSGTSHAEIKALAAKLSSSIDRLSRRWPTFIQHLLATEIFGVIEIGANADHTILCKELVAFTQWAAGVKEDDTLDNDRSLHCQIHVRLLACSALKSFFNEPGLEQLRQRINGILEPLTACPVSQYKAHIDDLVSAAQDLGKAVLVYPGFVRINWVKPSPNEDWVLMFPSLTIDENHRGQLVAPNLRKELYKARVRHRENWVGRSAKRVGIGARKPGSASSTGLH
ncbi:hypothetical protein MMC30_000839 [Trapelia coarctata]|nr:hypothetical protein [Trapelia coarctata]